MGAVEYAVDAAAKFVGPLTNLHTGTQATPRDGNGNETQRLVSQALSHLQSINSADLTTDPNAPYDASLAGVVYGLLDIITSYGILPHLSPGVAFSQRPQSLLSNTTPLIADRDESRLDGILNALVPMLEQKCTGVQPLLSQRSLPDIISALAELSFSPVHPKRNQAFTSTYARVMSETPTSRLLPILTTFLQQPLPTWLKSVVSRELALVPSRPHGIRHTIEFLSLSYLAKVSQVPQNVSGFRSELPIPLEAVTEATRVIVLPPAEMDQDKWLHQLAPQLWSLLDGEDGTELSRAAGQIIAQGILSKRSTGAPDTVGWRLFALPVHERICPKDGRSMSRGQKNGSDILVQEQDLETALKRMLAIISSYSQPGVLRRLINPVLSSIWELLNHAQERPALNQKWRILARGLILRYMSVACDANQVDAIATNLFWDGDAEWAFMPGSFGGVEIRSRKEDQSVMSASNVLARVACLSTRVDTLVSLLADAQVSDTVLGSVFVQVSKRWLSPEASSVKPLLTNETDPDPFIMLIDAKISETMAFKFRDNFARSPQHIIELMCQLLTKHARNHKVKVQDFKQRTKVTRGNLRNIATPARETTAGVEDENADEQLASFAMSIISTLITSSNFEQTSATRTVLQAVVAPLEYLCQDHPQHSPSIVIRNSATNLLHALRSIAESAYDTEANAATEHRSELQRIIAGLTSPEPPDRTWALNKLRQFLRTQEFFDIVDIPSTTHLLLSASLTDPESYVHTAAIPVLTELALRAPNFVVDILVDAFIDVDERSLKAVQGRQSNEKDVALLELVDFRLRVGEVLNDFILAHNFFQSSRDTVLKHRALKLISEACLSLANRRGQRTQTRLQRTQRDRAEQAIQEEAEAAWEGPIPNLLDPEGENPQDQADRDALLKIVQGWEDTGIEEDVRVRASALSVLSTVLKHRIALLRQATVGEAMQMASLILTMETTEPKAVLRRAAVMMFMDMLRGLDEIVGSSENTVGLDAVQQNEITRVLQWIEREDSDDLVRDHAASVLEDLETWRMKKLYQVSEEGLGQGLKPDLGLEGKLRGLNVQPQMGGGGADAKRMRIEEID